MSLITKGGVYCDLSISTYLHNIHYEDSVLHLHFSSRFNRDRYIEKVLENRIKTKFNIAEKNNITLDTNKMADLVLYSKVENRGFYCTIKGETFTCLKNIIFDLQPQTKSDCPIQSEPTTQS